MTEMLLGATGGGASAARSLGVSELPQVPLRGFISRALPADFWAREALLDLIPICSGAAVFVVEAKPGVGGHLYSTALPPTIVPSNLADRALTDLDTTGYRRRELEWRRTHGESLRAFGGEWVVLEGEDIIAHGHDPVQAVAEARAKGIRVPYIFYVEPQTDDVVRMGL